MTGAAPVTTTWPGPGDLPTGLSPGGRFDEWSGAWPSYLVADVDGTLVGPSGAPSPSVLAAAAAAVAGGLRLGVATGRMRQGAERIAAAIGSAGPDVFHNGAEVRLDGEQVHATPLSAGQVRALLACPVPDNAYLELYTEDGFFVSSMDGRAGPHWELLGSDPIGRTDDIALPDADADASPVLKGTFAVFGDDVAAVEAIAASVELQHGIGESPITPDIRYVNVTSAATDKGVALRAAAGAIAVDLTDVGAVGDAHNDLPLLAVAGLAVAMGQASPDVRAAAHLVCPSVDDDGVAVLLSALTGTARRRDDTT